ncbi:HAD domain-containing protein [Oxalicibacterium faecigallinarum]|uniref:Uncharacterized protein n=1 Tax=Oxalicibacterium faecigallinarum TaxID=573741 RepID=A0A8J3AWM8_9BURK|nr:HAD domain-containing protein [Oxalicibacterium faecigallinarum]GGI17598.1 hypothetical protein GCM10008066_09780 [Oxalicibacterium faecigallinarum]
MRVILALDFDGVLHSIHGAAFEHLRRFESILRQFPEVDVVVSSSWRETYAWEDILSYFSKDLHPRFIGPTPVLSVDSQQYPAHVRYLEIRKFLADSGRDPHRWIALDDDVSLFPPMCGELVLCDAKKGLDAATARLLRKRLWQLQKIGT